MNHHLRLTITKVINYPCHQIPATNWVHQAVLVSWSVMVHQTVLWRLRAPPADMNQQYKNMKPYNNHNINNFQYVNIWLNKLLNHTLNMYVNKKLKRIECVKKYQNILEHMQHHFWFGECNIWYIYAIMKLYEIYEVAHYFSMSELKGAIDCNRVSNVVLKMGWGCVMLL